MGDVRLLIVGGGRMGEALLGGLRAAGWDGLGVVESVAERREWLAAAHPDVLVAAEPVAADGVVIAVKPADAPTAARASAAAGCKRALSVCAGVTLATLETCFPQGTPVVRSMPNTPAFVGAGAAAISAGSAAGVDDLDWAEGVLGSVGVVVRLPEKLLDAVTGLSGSGPAYVFLVAEALIDAGVLAGLPRDVATTLTLQTILGSARMLLESGETPEALRAAVTSPGGTTAAGLRALEDRAIRAGFLDAVTAATARSVESGRS